MEEKLFSIIVPVYKVEKYLNQCVDSLLNQTYKNFEVILVDDGSPDNCPAICDEYAEKDNRIKVVHKSNGGLSNARNEGVKNANGKYLLFVDSDDYYGDNEFLYKLSEHIKKYSSQVVNFPFRTFSAKTGEFYGDQAYSLDEITLNGLKSKKEQIQFLIENDKLQISACTYAIKRLLFIEKELFFEEGLLSEDVEWAMRMLSVVEKISFLNAPGLYSRRGREGSISSSIKHKNISDLIYIIEKNINKFKSADYEVEKILLNYISYQYTIVLALLCRVNDKKFERETLKKLKNYEFLLDYKLNPKVKKVSKIVKIFGFNLTTKILQFYLKHRSR